MIEETIAAISTPFGEGAIALLRMSGPGAIEIANQIFRGKQKASELPSRVQHLGELYDGALKLDEVLVSIHRAPGSYTGEDLVEISCHGGVLIAQRILELLLARGARSAEPGEFTQRAYLHGKMDLTQAEAVRDLIAAQTDLALRAANEQLEGRLGVRIRDLRERLLEVLAQIEAYIDFPEEGIAPETGKELLGRIEAIRAEIQSLLATAARGRVLREGVRTVIYGAPNVGKSSLLNVLLGYERAIVSARPGTTRDIIEEVINLRGIPLRLVDTAGIHESVDEIEQEGMARTRREIGRADLILEVADVSQPAESVAAPEDAVPGDGSHAVRLLVLNKSDLREHASWQQLNAVRISCLTGAGIDQLEEAIVAQISGGNATHRDWSLAINARHKACLQRALQFTDAARKGLIAEDSPELIAEELRSALDAVGDVVGRAETEELLTKIFSTFCIGK